MVEINEIKDELSLRDWLRALPYLIDLDMHEVQRRQVSLDYRTAMRVLPVYWLWSFSEEAQQHSLGPIHILYAGVAVGVFANTGVSVPEIGHAAIQGASASAGYAKGAGYYAGRAMVYAARAASSLRAPPHRARTEESLGILNYSGSLMHDAGDAVSQSWEAVRDDCAVLAEGRPLDNCPLWAGRNPISDVWVKVREKTLAQGPEWQFWVDWYNAALVGRRQDWNLLSKVSEINYAHLRKGADHVNALIQQIIKQHTLAAEAVRLKVENERLVEQLRALEQRSHNNPPEGLVDDLPKQQHLTELSQQLDDVAQELEKPRPSRSRLVKIATLLLHAAKTIAADCGGLADTALNEGAKALGKAGGIAAVGYLAIYSEQVQTFANALLAFARTLAVPSRMIT